MRTFHRLFGTISAAILIAMILTQAAAAQVNSAVAGTVEDARKALIPGVVTHASNLVEHPETIAQRIARFVGAVGRENVIAGADCGFASFSTSCEVHPTVVWAKLAALAEGARLATNELWGRP